jgi:hypothetical protein
MGDALEHARTASRAPRSDGWRPSSLRSARVGEDRSKRPVVEQVDIASPYEVTRIRREVAGGHDDAAGHTPGGHHTVQFTNRGDADLLSSPLLALHERRFPSFYENEIHSPIRTTTAGVRDREAIFLRGAGTERGIEIGATTSAQQSTWKPWPRWLTPQPERIDVADRRRAS